MLKNHLQVYERKGEKRRMQFYTSQFKCVSPKRKRDKEVAYTCLFKSEQRFAIN